MYIYMYLYTLIMNIENYLRVWAKKKGNENQFGNLKKTYTK